MIFLTWIEKRSWLRGYGKPVAALWARHWSHDDYRSACVYAAQCGDDYGVHSFDDSVDYDTAKAWALESAARADQERRAASDWILWPAC